MFRPGFAQLLLWLGAASSATAQMASDASWTLAFGEYTVYGHTTYSPALSLVPRVVFDSVRRLDSALVVDSVRRTSPAPAPTTDPPAVHAGLAAGMSGWPGDLYCSGPASAAMQSLAPDAVLRRVQLAARCGVRLVIVPTRRMLTTTGLTSGPFSLDSAKRLTDRYAAALPPDTIAKYHSTILGFNLGDDYRCTSCWGGKEIGRAQIAAWAAYTRTRLPGMPLGVRITPDWVASYPALAPLLDYTWAQYDTRKGDPQAWYDTAARTASSLGLRVVMGVNVEDCHGQSTAPCSAAELARFGTVAVEHPGSCGFINWRYDDETWARTEMREVWDGLMVRARGREGRECRR